MQLHPARARKDRAHRRTPLLCVAFALSFSGCSCEYHASVSKTYSTSGGDRVVVVEDPQADAREREARFAREREWERERERERSRHPRRVGQAGSGTQVGSVPTGSSGSGGGRPHAPPSIPVQPGHPSSIGPVPSGQAPSSVGQPAPTAQPSAPVTPAPAPIAQPSAPVTPAPAPPLANQQPAPPPPPPSDNYVPARDVSKPAGGPAKAGSSGNEVDNSKGTQRRGVMRRQP